MPYQFSPFGNDQFFDSNGNLAVGYKLFTYLAGTSTKEAIAADIEGLAFHTNPIVLNAYGLPPAPLFLDLLKSYKFVFAGPTDTDPPTSPFFTFDDVAVTAAGELSQWIDGTTPTYISGSQFSVVGDQRTIYHVGRRVQLIAIASSTYGTISASSFAAGVTTVTVLVDNLAVISASLSAVKYGWLTADGSAWPSGFNTGLLTSFYGSQINKTSKPSLRLIGTESGGKDVKIEEDNGAIIFYRNTGTETAPTWVEKFRIQTDVGFYTPKTRVVYTSGSGNFTVPDGVTSIRVKVWGASGGGGGGGGGAGGSGGGGNPGGSGTPGKAGSKGGYGEDSFIVTPATVYTVTVGAGGPGGSGGGGGAGGFGSNPPGSTGTPGTAGGTSSLGALISATGGGGGPGSGAIDPGSDPIDGSLGTSGATINLTGFGEPGGVGGSGGGGGAGNPACSPGSPGGSGTPGTVGRAGMVIVEY